MRLTDLRLYPVKSAAGVTVSRADVEPWGLREDRRWVILDARGERVGAKRCPRLMAIAARPDGAGGITLSAPDAPTLPVAAPGPDATPVRTDLYGLGSAPSAGAAADAWVSRVLGQPAHLVWQADPTRRPVAAKHGGQPGDVVSFADLAPLLLVTTASLRQLDDWIAAGAAERGEPTPGPLDPARFRPNAILDAGAPFAEETWRRLRIGDVAFRLAEHCDRCAVTLIEPATQERGREPLRTLAVHRRRHGKTWFGIRVIPERPGTIAVGDPVTPLD